MNYVTVVFVSDEDGVAPIEARHFGDTLDEDGVKMFVAHKLRSLNAHDTAWQTLKDKRADEAIAPAEIVSPEIK